MSLSAFNVYAADLQSNKKEIAMKLNKYDSSAGFEGPADYFTGKVQVGEPFKAGDNFDDYQGAMVNFDAGARTAWHTHPKGQTLYIISGEGRAQSQGETVRKLMPGDVVWFPANEKHWHGAAPDTSMSHIAIQSSDSNGEVVTWLDHVTDEEYKAPTE
tara:strand:+ start:1581 stop:2054 length:474 start_codon:yes stop_codon:yes gene_type:complete